MLHASFLLLQTFLATVSGTRKALCLHCFSGTLAQRVPVGTSLTRGCECRVTCHVPRVTCPGHVSPAVLHGHLLAHLPGAGHAVGGRYRGALLGSVALHRALLGALLGHVYSGHVYNIGYVTRAPPRCARSCSRG